MSSETDKTSEAGMTPEFDMSTDIGKPAEATTDNEKEPLIKKTLLRSITIIDEEDYYKEKIFTDSNVHGKNTSKAAGYTTQKIMIVAAILFMELCERMAFYGVSANLILFCTSVLELSSIDATNISLTFIGTVYLLPILGGIIADIWSNRFNVIYGAGLIYICGLFLILSSSADYAILFDEQDANPTVETRRLFFLFGLVLVAIGTGGIKANVGLFGAHQVQDLGPEAVQVYFNWFYWFINAGAILAFSLVAYIQQNISFMWGYFLSFVAMVMALALLNLARNCYIYKDPQGSVLVTSMRICHQACCRKSPVIAGKRHLFDSARIQYGGDYDNLTVDGVIAVLRVLPIFFFIVIYWTIYAQMETTYFLQGERMDLSAGEMQMPVAMLNVFNGIVVLVLIPILDRFVYPCFQRLHRPLSYMHRIGIGIVLSACSIVVAGWVEIERKKYLGFDQVVGEQHFQASNMTVFLQIPQYALVGAGEAFTCTAGYEFAYTQAPDTMQGLITGLYLATIGLGSYFSTAVMVIIEAATGDDPWFPDEINNGKTEYVFFVFGGLGLAFFLAYLPVAQNYKYREYSDDSPADVNGKSSDEISKNELTMSVTML